MVVVVVVSADLVLVYPIHFIKRKPIERGWRRVRLGTVSYNQHPPNET
jgi:hypothetical protein